MYYISEEEFCSNIYHRINKDIKDLEIKDPIESFDFPGFYHVPTFDDLLISKANLVRSIEKNKILSNLVYTNKKGYDTQVASCDYKRNGKFKRKKFNIARLVALTFIGRPSKHLNKDYRELEVNHINGISLENKLVNLEWVTRQENAQHARLHLPHSQEIPVLAKNLLTEEVIDFKTRNLCAEHFNIPKSTFFDYLASKRPEIGVKDNHIFKYDDGSAWPIFDCNNTFIVGTANTLIPKRSVLATPIFGGNAIPFDSIVECAAYFNVEPTLIILYLKPKYVNKGRIDDYLFQYKDDE